MANSKTPLNSKGQISELLLKLVPTEQLNVMLSSAEHADVITKMSEKVNKIPDINETDSMVRHPLALHYFAGSCDWYVCEWDKEDTFFGYVILNNDIECSEWGYINRKELLELEHVFIKNGLGVLNLDFHCRYETIEDALYARDKQYFNKYNKEVK